MRRCLLLLVCFGLVVPAAAYAATIACDGGRCEGTKKPDQMTTEPAAEGDNIFGKGGGDTIRESSFAGSEQQNDDVHGGAGRDDIDFSPAASGVDQDLIYGGDGDDTIDVREGDRLWQDIVNCGPGRDTVIADDPDKVSSNCEDVDRP
jgi:Ca2+-binding RTX toxin-like protein